ncbi:probable LRR receptor-like serine/threonine-protein kinase At4g29180 [Salvia splendens]|uniref:probable LRR receptor-like serine/threonine-protein kinase At4g29180 n=1 Tax=Salvia splendens TaxID=180675 RepID=UPI001C25A16D|nr:probable LRR receptor-like serine/threonine-protein kinase At4g29180 [Salvia splendens]
MHKSVIPFVLFNLILYSQGQPDSWIGIDCGSNKSTSTFDFIWDTDEACIKSGTNHLVPNSTIISFVTFQTLRVFTDQNKNCYTLPKTSSYGYFIRAAFLYANYDGQSRPPTFDLEIDGNKWTTRIISVCLATTNKDEIPFISSLEAWPIYYTMYTGLSRDMAWLSTYRYDYGSSIGVLGYAGRDDFNRIWEPIVVAGAVNTSGNGQQQHHQLHHMPESMLPPIISAIEIYTATDPLIANGTNQSDLNGLMSFTNVYTRLSGWSGEPCLPSDTVWQWLGCSATVPPRATSLYLSGYQLNRRLTNFQQMQALVDIDLSNNSLSGQIPDFLGQLPNLRKLNQSHNDFSGEVPTTIRHNKRLTYEYVHRLCHYNSISYLLILNNNVTNSVSGNPNLDRKDGGSSKTALIVGLAVGIPLLVIAALLIVFWLRRVRKTENGSTNTQEPLCTSSRR